MYQLWNGTPELANVPSPFSKLPGSIWTLMDRKRHQRRAF